MKHCLWLELKCITHKKSSSLQKYSSEMGHFALHSSDKSVLYSGSKYQIEKKNLELILDYEYYNSLLYELEGTSFDTFLVF